MIYVILLWVVSGILSSIIFLKIQKEEISLLELCYTMILGPLTFLLIGLIHFIEHLDTIKIGKKK